MGLIFSPEFRPGLFLESGTRLTGIFSIARENFSIQTCSPLADLIEFSGMEFSDDLLSRGINKIYPDRQTLEQVLKERKISIYWGIDPTAPDLHLSNMENLLILKRFQDLGHKIIMLIGDATAQVGDPSERATKRRRITKDQVLQNAREYQNQAEKIVNFTGDNPARLVFNSEWWEKMTFLEVMDKVGYHFTSQQLLERSMFQNRIKAGNPPTVSEFLYPLMQGYDSVALEVDAELGGTDQIFNMLVGRDLSKQILGKEKFVIAKKLLADPRTGEMLMNKSRGNYIPMREEPSEMFGRIMALPDEILKDCFELWTPIPLDQVQKLLKEAPPMEAKKRLAYEVVSLLHSSAEADRAQVEFRTVFAEGGIPREAPVWPLAGKKIDLTVLLVEKKVVKSKSEGRRLLKQGGISLNDKKLNEPETILESGVLKIGKKTFIEIK